MSTSTRVPSGTSWARTSPRAYGVDFDDGALLGSVVFAGHDGAGRMRSLTEREQAVLHNAVRQARVM